MRVFLLIILAICSLARPALAARGPWVSDGAVKARLIAAVDGTGQLASLPLGLDIQMQPGWKTYWRSPGEAGLPPKLDMKASGITSKAVFAWPLPQRFSLLGLETFGYENEVVLPFSQGLDQPGAAATLTGTAQLLVCAQICVPHTLHLSLNIPAGPALPGAEAQLIGRFANLVPNGTQAAGLKITRARLLGQGSSAALVVDATAPQPFQKPDIFPESATLDFGPPQVTLSDAAHHARITLPILHQPPGEGLSTAMPLTLTLADGPRFVEAKPKLEAAPWPSMAARLLALIPLIGLALLGGLILNVMPCVLPVLSLKLLMVVQQGGAERAHVRAGFLASAAGILSSFLLIAGILLVLKAGGHSIGWGLQFQQLWFLALMVPLLVLFSASLFGLIEFALPGGLQQKLGAAGPTSLAGHFFSGAFATLLATPCSAPFLGTAIGYALTSGTVEILAVFAALGIGMALPFLLVAAFPNLVARLPRPGLWMVRLKQYLGFPLLGTALWLLLIVRSEAGTPTALILGLASLMLLTGLMVWRHRRGLPLAWPSLRLAAGFATAALATVLVVVHFGPADTTDSPAANTLAWQSFNTGAIKTSVAQGKVVFVDVTAKWCLTCQANKRLVLDSEPVNALLRKPGLIDMKADWTKPNAAIAAFLARHGRFGIPFNIVYGPGAPGGIALPELLTSEAVVAALARAGKV